ncbi:hypothetical protein [Herbaspirillum sp. VT-16-41]|uniref:hypothetical protein n=1 Tax=Herbaspirillum sp. VT-16-41 TaxID=1953765 RepID=UPI000981B821|nr:hypothetical protein [Herbaspirillum sp. VT-16-41]ONN67807.1 hypothetical protein BTM36_04550 [Herbaspirillum sp. VT-16-41]
MQFSLSEAQGRFLGTFLELKVRFMLIGGKAMQVLGIERATADLDLWVSRDQESTNGICATLKKLYGVPDGVLDRMGTPNVRVPIPNPTVPEIDLLTSIDGLTFDDVFAGGEDVFWNGRSLRIPSVADLICTKRIAIATNEAQISSGRLDERGIAQANAGMARDLADIALLSRRER